MAFIPLTDIDNKKEALFYFNVDHIKFFRPLMHDEIVAQEKGNPNIPANAKTVINAGTDFLWYVKESMLDIQNALAAVDVKMKL